MQAPSEAQDEAARPVAVAAVHPGRAPAEGGRSSALELWDEAVEQLLESAEDGLFASKLQLDTRSSRIVYTGYAAQSGGEHVESGDRSKVRTFVLDVPMIMLMPPQVQSQSLSNNRVRLGAYLAQWMSYDALLDVALRSCVESAVSEVKLMRAIINTAMGSHRAWLEWTEESFTKLGLSISASQMIFFAVMTIYFSASRDLLVPTQLRALPKALTEDASMLDELVQSLCVLLVLTAVNEDESEAFKTVAWMFANSHEKDLLQNAVGATLENLLKLDKEATFISEALFKNDYFPNALDVIIQRVDGLNANIAYAPTLPAPSQDEIQQFSYPWPEMLIEILSSKQAQVSSVLSAHGRTELLPKLETCHKLVQEKEPSIMHQVESSFATKTFSLVRDVLHGTVNPAAAVQAKEKRSAARSLRISPKRKGVTGSKQLTAAATIQGSDILPDRISDPEWKHIKASDALIDFLWQDGVPWSAPFSAATPPHALKPIECFSVGGPQVSKTMLKALASVSDDKVGSKEADNVLNWSDPMFRTPHPILISYATVASARACILAQYKRFKSDADMNVNEVVKSCAFTLSAAIRAHGAAEGVDQRPDQRKNVKRMRKHVKDKAVTSRNAPSLLALCRSRGFNTRGAGHVAIAQTIRTGAWKPTSSQGS